MTRLCEPGLLRRLWIGSNTWTTLSSLWLRWAIILVALYLILASALSSCRRAVAAVLTAALSATALALAGALEHIQFKPDVRGIRALPATSAG